MTTKTRKHLTGSRIMAAVCLLGMAAAGTGCGKSPEAEPSVRQEGSLTPPVHIERGMSLSGRVVLLGGRPAGAGHAVDVGANPYCSSHGAVVDATWKVAEDGGLADVVITVDGSPRASDVPADPVLIDQVGCQYHPTVTVIQAGQSVCIRNSDDTFHNVRIVRHAVGTRNGGENLDNIGQPTKGTETIRAFDQIGIYRLECDVHRWMKSWIYVHSGIHIARTNDGGRFEIPWKLADGEYKVSAWHPQFERPVVKTVAVREGRASVDFEFDLQDAFQP